MISETLAHRETSLVGNDRLYQEQVLLRVSGLTQAFGGQKVLDGVDLTLSAGEVVLLKGANGSGKTTLLNVLTGNLEPDGGQIELYTWMFFASESAAKKHTGADGLANTPNITHPQKLHTPKTKRICQRTNYSSA
ncbi:MAG: ATP-binding cassette domain-containing protein [Limnohabitans sp.]